MNTIIHHAASAKIHNHLLQKAKRALRATAILLLLLYSPWTFAQSPDPIVTAVEAHGGQTLRTIVRIQMRGQSLREQGLQTVTISAALIGPEAGSLRVDYGSTAIKSFYNTPRGTAEASPGQLTVFKPAQVGLFAQLDILSGLGIQHLATPAVQRSTPAPSVVNGRAANKVRAVTGRTKTLHRRSVADDVDVDIDAQTGLVSAITRRLLTEQTMDVSFLAGFRFSDYRAVQGVVVPFRIDRVLNGVTRESIQLDTVELNPPLTSGFFDPPNNDYRRNPVGKTTLGGR